MDPVSLRHMERATLAAFDDRIAEARRLHGGDLSDVTMLTLQGGARVVAKAGPKVETEARMLRALENAGAPVPKVLSVSTGLMFIEALSELRHGAGSWARVGDALRALHRAKADAPYGWDEDYAFGSLPIVNRHYADWAAFWGQNRLLAPAEGLPPGVRPRLLRLVEKLPDILPAAPRPSLLHGDLWSGNLLFGAAPDVWFIDPACYIGHSEVDLAMLHLFGQPGAGFSDAYGALEAGWQERRAVYTLWPALVHFRLFGASYRGMVERLLSQLGA